MSKHELELYVDTFDRGSLRSKHKLELYVDSFWNGVLRSKHKLELYVDSFVGNFFHANGGLVTKNSGPLRAREGEVRLG